MARDKMPAPKKDSGLYRDPIRHLEDLVRRRYDGGSDKSDPLASEIFQGKWIERDWPNVPGPLYGAMTDNCWVGEIVSAASRALRRRQ